jgi:hypothetical protein
VVKALLIPGSARPGVGKVVMMVEEMKITRHISHAIFLNARQGAIGDESLVNLTT